jgi:hypothetical protein
MSTFWFSKKSRIFSAGFPLRIMGAASTPAAFAFLSIQHIASRPTLSNCAQAFFTRESSIKIESKRVKSIAYKA